MFRALLLMLLLLPVSLHSAELRDKGVIDFDVVWGAYYAAVPFDDGPIIIFRLIDFNKDSYHISIYKEEYEKIPSYEMIRGLPPISGHAPLSLRDLLHYKSVVLLGGEPLTKSDLVGYMLYLEHFGASKTYREKLSNNLIQFSKGAPMKLRLEFTVEEVAIRDR